MHARSIESLAYPEIETKVLPPSPAYQQVETQEQKRKPHKLRRFIAAGSLALMGSLFVHGDQHMPDEILLAHPEKPAAAGDTLNVMTANVHGWSGEQGDNFDNFLGAMETEGVDVACVQEFVNEGSKLSRLFDAGYDVYFSKTVHWPWRSPFGNAIVSKAPLDYAESVSLPNKSLISPRKALMGEIMMKQGAISVTNTHLSTNKLEADRQTRALLPFAQDNADIMCGDFNLSTETVASGSLGGVSSPAFFSARIKTFPASINRLPDRDIDLIFSSCGRPISGQRSKINIDSDHYARIQKIDVSDCFDD